MSVGSYLLSSVCFFLLPNHCESCLFMLRRATLTLSCRHSGAGVPTPLHHGVLSLYAGGVMREQSFSTPVPPGASATYCQVRCQ